MNELGFQKISLENWLKPDNLNSIFVRSSENSTETHIITDKERLADILKTNLSEKVPIEIHRLYEVARGAIAYGYFFYPLYTLGAEQLFRVAETAVNFKYKSVNGPKNINTYSKRLEYLEKNNIISSCEKDSFDNIRKLRNISSHPKNQSIIMPTRGSTSIRVTRGKVNSKKWSIIAILSNSKLIKDYFFEL